MEGITLPPEAKIHMALDDIIRIEKPFLGISHNMYKRKRPQYMKRTYQPHWRRRRFISQNWRLRGNGPRAPRNRTKILNFLERKYATKPLHSVFQRLGYRNQWINQWDMSRKKLRNARRTMNYSSRVPPFQQRIEIDPSMQPPATEPPKPLTKVDFAKLREVLGGFITSISQKSTEDGALITTIRGLDNSFDSRSDIHSNSNMSVKSDPQQPTDSDIINNLNNGHRTFLGGTNAMSSIAQNQSGMASSQQPNEGRIFNHIWNRAYGGAGSVMDSQMQSGCPMDFSGSNEGSNRVFSHIMQNSLMNSGFHPPNNMECQSTITNSAASIQPIWMNSNGNMNGVRLSNFNMSKNMVSANSNMQQNGPGTNFIITPHSSGPIQARFKNGPDISIE